MLRFVVCKDVTTPTFGPTECEILAILWEQGPLTIRQVRDTIRKRRPIAYTTILTTSERMEDKGLIVRTPIDWRRNSTLTLTPALSRAQLVAHAVAKSAPTWAQTPTCWPPWNMPAPDHRDHATHEIALGRLSLTLLAWALVVVVCASLSTRCG